ncbi:uncharacterized protein LOC119167835 [Rhipicephalus microplus]|uniref:uncharacterized protein LOC119167835 n=1 Tax=Rhipicephalus microplus TaxID=6941 RepID=UPI003F6C6385
MANARVRLFLFVSTMAILPLVTPRMHGRQRGPGWVRAPAARFWNYRKLAQRAVYIASQDNSNLYHVVVINEIRSRPEGKREHIQMKLKVAESVCLTKDGLRPKKPCPPRNHAPVRQCDLDIIIGKKWRFVHVFLDCAMPHH